ncbi:ribosome maturation factor RimP [Granulicoccus sp. GXG6511]|uniref:ribosome maturation factor RimP n=1 Tax=Granulicoccus sp. GXG6511 TaxID=3381351 RepID=UPI003D7F157F
MKDGQLTSLLTPLLAQFALELDSLDSVPAGRRRLLRIVVDGDGPEGRGPSLDDISEATKAISVALDEADFLGQQPYTLEVSSRGISRPLTEPKHWRRNAGRLVKANLVEGGEVTGRVLTSTEEVVTLEVVTDPKKQTTTERDLPLAEIAKALVQVEFVSAKKDKTQTEEGED